MQTGFEVKLRYRPGPAALYCSALGTIHCQLNLRKSKQ